MAGPRAVADTNVWVAAAIAPGGVCGHLLALVIEGQWEPVVSPLLLQELADVLARQRFRRWLSVDDASRFVEDLIRIAESFNDPAVVSTLRTRDPNDEFLIVLAVAAHVEALVSGDFDLLDSEDVTVPVVSPAAFLSNYVKDLDLSVDRTRRHVSAPRPQPVGLSTDRIAPSVGPGETSARTGRPRTGKEALCG